MGAITRVGAGIGATVLSVAALTATPTAALSARVIRVQCSSPALRTAITAANTLGAATLRLAAHCIYNYTDAVPTTENALPLITGNVTLIGGPSTTIRRDPAATTPAFRLFHVLAAGTLRIERIFLLNGIGPTDGGGAITNDGTVVLNFTTLSGNTTAAAGGGGALINTAATARALIAHSVISNNSTIAGNGGGIDNLGGLTLIEDRVSGNNAVGNGGGVATEVGGTTRIVQTTIDHNTATINGGGVFNAGTTSLIRTLVVRNRAVLGGGVFGPVTIRGSIIRGNTPDNCSPVNPAC